MVEFEHSYVFIDESGDTGFKFNKGSSRYFCMAAVIFSGSAYMEEVDAAIANLRTDLHFKQTHEFHFNTERPEVREKLCLKVRDHPFIIRAILVDKAQVTDHQFRKSSKRFYQIIAQQLLEQSLAGIDKVKVVFDGKTSKDLKHFLRSELNKEARIVADVLFEDSGKNSLIQLADLAASGIARSYQPDKGEDFDHYRRLLARRIDQVYEYHHQTIEAILI